jgi:hypothetical protein
LPAPAAPDPLVLLVWLALVAPAAGWLAGALRLHALVLAPVAPAVWAAALVVVDLSLERDLPAPAAACAVLAGLFLAGYGAGRALAAGRAGEGAVGSAALLALGALLGGLATGGGLAAAPWPPALAARLLDLSPAALAAESAGVDWLRQPGVYASAGSAHIDPRTRRPYRGVLAGPSALVVGCALAAVGVALDRRRRSTAGERAAPGASEAHTPEAPCSAASTSAPSRSS